MKKHIIKRASCALVLGLAFIPAAVPAAQDVGSLGKQAQNLGGMGSVSALTQKLHLSPQQLEQVLPILQGESPKLQSIMGNTGLSKTQKTEQTKAVQKQSDSKLKGILSPTQFTSLQSFRSQQLQQVLQGAISH